MVHLVKCLYKHEDFSSNPRSCAKCCVHWHVLIIAATGGEDEHIFVILWLISILEVVNFRFSWRFVTKTNNPDRVAHTFNPSTREAEAGRHL